MNCYFCDKILPISSIHPDEYHCDNCNCTIIPYVNKSVRMIYLFYKQYYIYLDFHNRYYALYNKDSYDRVFLFNSLPNINPKNIESKINTILAFI